MKKISVFTALIVALGLFSCEPGDDALDSLIASEIDVASEAGMSASFEEVDQIVEDGIEHCYNKPQNSDGRHGRFGNYRFGRLTDCTEITRDTVNQIITIDFGEGCEDIQGTVRSGIIKIAYNELRNVPGAYRIVSFEDFFVDSVGVEGTRTITNISEEADSLSRSFEVLLEGGKLSFPDESTITRDAEHERTSYITEDRSEAYSAITGSAQGVLRSGTAYTVTILEEIIYKHGCRDERVVIPVSGIKEIRAGEDVVLINFGDGTCDNLVEITINGETTVREIEPRGRKRRRG
ncbi:hypothetical protein [Marinoscillum sp.]|uniref:hypothetical protein n=1 Tax=Marinoscillum sp. TaxID=2024838 RepID=UPI003BADB8CD